MQPHTKISVMVTLVATAVLFCAAALTVLLVKPLAAQGILLLPTVLAMSVPLAAALGWSITPKLLARNWEQGHRPARTPGRTGETHDQG